MTTFKIETLNKEFNLTTSWNEIKLDQFINFMKLQDNAKLFDTPEDPTIGQAMFMIQVLCILTDATKQEIEELPLSQLDFISKSLEMLQIKPEFEPKQTLLIDGMEYGFRDLNDFKLGEHISFKTLQSKHLGWDAIPYLLAIICRPMIDGVIEVFDSTKINGRIEMFNKCNAIEVMGAANFFLSGKPTLSKLMNGSIQQEEMEHMTQEDLN